MGLVLLCCIDTTVGYLLGEKRITADLFKDPAMLKRFQGIATLPEKEKGMPANYR